MKVSDFEFDLPEELIAQEPLVDRSSSRLLVMDRRNGALQDRRFVEILDLLTDRDLLVFNNTRVIPARLYAHKPTGGRVEILVERVVDGKTALAQLGANRKPIAGTVLRLPGVEAEITIGQRDREFWPLSLQADATWLELLHEHGHMPLPPYITRDEQPADRDRYQTVFAEVPGAVAAPTAGLHFDTALFERLDEKGVRRASCTLHVGAGTFQPVRVETVEDHTMHPEWLSVSPELVEAIGKTRERGGRVVAVGTTAVRSLETAAAGGTLQPFTGDSRLFIYPGYSYRVVDAMITNFHLPGSTLMMLVSAFSDREQILAAYRHAIGERYRFFSYGDAMWIG